MKTKRTSDGRKLDHATLQAIRQQAVKLIDEGQDVASVAAAYGVNKRSVYRWLAAFAHGGQDALLAKSIPGRPPKVRAEEMQWLAQAVRDHSPLQFKFEFGLWTLSLIAALIERQFGKKLALSGGSRIMKLLGFAAQKRLYKARQRDATLVRHWEFETYPAIRAEAREVGATIYFADESGIRSDYHTGTTRAPQGCTPLAVSFRAARSVIRLSRLAGSKSRFGDVMIYEIPNKQSAIFVIAPSPSDSLKFRLQASSAFANATQSKWSRATGCTYVRLTRALSIRAKFRCAGTKAFAR